MCVEVYEVLQVSQEDTWKYLKIPEKTRKGTITRWGYLSSVSMASSADIDVEWDQEKGDMDEVYILTTDRKYLTYLYI